MSITDFLLARIAEDEAVARAAISTDEPDAWENPTQTQNHWPANIAFWDRVTPARVLAECAAKRAIVAAHEAYAQEAIESTGIAFVGARVGQQATGDILRTLAAVYANHPGYRAEWAIHQGGWRG